MIADASNPASLASMARSTKVIVTTVGPYQLYGEPLVAACVEAGTDYVDLCGEPAWMAAMIGKYDAKAKASGARIVFSCGFDSIPFDLGVTFLQDQAKDRLGAPLQRVRGRVRKMKGGFSGGTIASLMATLESSKRDPSIVTTLADPFALTPVLKGRRSLQVKKLSAILSPGNGRRRSSWRRSTPRMSTAPITCLARPGALILSMTR